MSTRAWLRPLALLMFAVACGGGTPDKKKKRRSGKRKRAKMRKQEAQKADDANVAVKTSSQTVERKGNAPADAPNVLLVSLDTLRADVLPPYGGRTDITPTIAALAKDGVVFQKSWAQAPSTSPTHASMFTSALPADHGLMGTNGRLPEEWLTLAEHMQSYGIRTWASTSSVRFALGVQLNQGFEEYAVYSYGSQTEKSNKALDVALAAIDKDPDRPWFGFVHLMDVHAPYDVPEPHQSRYLQGPTTVPPDKTVNFLHRYRLSPEKVSPRKLRDVHAMYDGGVSFVDTRIEALWGAVQKLDRPTVIVITSDHGEAFFEKNFLGHGTFVHEPIVRVPLIFWGPGIIPQGGHRVTLAQSIDLFPTLSTIVGLPVPDGLMGEDLTPVLRGEGEKLGRTVISQSKKRMCLVRDTPEGLFKVVVNGKGKRPRVYDLREDPHEQTDISAKHSQLAEDWAAELRTVAFSKHRTEAETWEMTDEEREALEAIGYMDADDH